MKWSVALPSTLVVSALAVSMSAYAANSVNNEVTIGKQLDAQKNVQQYWTPERLKNAQELTLPIADVNTVQKMPEIMANDQGEWGDGGLPQSVKVKPQQLFVMTENDEGDGVGGELPGDKDKRVPNDSGSYNQPYTSSRLIPLTADTSYPYRAVGKLFFTIQGKGDYVCSASVMRPRVVVTAGHCTHKGSAGTAGFYTNFYFVPAFRDGAAPYQGWYPSYVQTTSTWASGGGTVPNAADYSMFQIADKTIGSTVTKIGNVTGWLGYQTAALSFNHATLLGYPCNLDSCQKMHQVASRSGSGVSPNNVEYGSDMRGGSSGGPWVQNFGAYATGQVEGNKPGANRIIGITSYGYDSTSPKVQGSSIPDSRFISVLNIICGLQAGNC